MRHKFCGPVVVLASMLLTLGFFACASGGGHWGQNLDPNGKWWKKEGQSWDRKNKIFMVIGTSNPEWTDPDDLRRSSDLNARAEAASFMQSLVSNSMEEVRGKGYALVESRVKATAKESLRGSAIVARHFDKKKKRSYSLLKIDLRYFEEPVIEKTIKEGE